MVSLLHTYRTLAVLEISAGKTVPAFAGEKAAFGVNLTNRAPRARVGVALSHPGNPTLYCDLPPGQTCSLLVPVVAPRRGWLRLQRLTVHTRYPLGLLRAWARVELELRCLVYPWPEDVRLPPPAALCPLGGGPELPQS